MISLYTGTPGSGKSLDLARIIMLKLKMGINVIGTMYINKDMVKKYKGKYIFVDIYRRAWNDFFQVHRHFGYNVALITQYDRLIDRQLRALVEYQYIHRKVSNFGVKGAVLAMFFRGGLFVSVAEWYPVHEKTGSNFFLYRKKYSRFYDSYMAFDENATSDDTCELLAYLKPAEEPAPCVADGGAGVPPEATQDAT